MIEAIYTQLLEMSPYQWMALIFGLIYIFFAVKNKPICFVFGLISSAFWAYESYYILNLQFDAGLQVFYIAMSIWGLIAWWQGSNQEELAITSLSGIKHVFIVLICILLGLGLAYWGEHYLKTSMAFLDAFTTCLLIVGTFLLVRRILENWIYFLVADLFYIYIYGKSGAYLFVFIMIIYSVMAILGYKKWKPLRAIV